MLHRSSFLAGLPAALAVLAARPAPLLAQAPVPIRVALFPGEAAGQAYFGLDLGYFSRAGLDVQLVDVKNGSAIAAAVAGGSADVGLSNMISLAIAHERGLPFTIVAAGGLALSSAPTNGILAVTTASPIRSAKDLNGKIVAVDVLGGLPHIAGRAWIDANGGDSKSVKYVELAFAEMEAAAVAGRVDAISINLSVDPTIGKPGDPLRMLAAMYDAVAPRLASSMWFSTDDFIAKNPDAIRKFVGAMRQAGTWANGHHHESAAILSKYIKQPAEQIESGARVVFATDNDPALFQPLIDVAAKYGSLKAAFPARDILLH